MTPDQMVKNFMDAMRADPELAVLAAMVDPYLHLMPDRSGVVMLLDRMAELWARSRGGRFDVEVAA